MSVYGDGYRPCARVENDHVVRAIVILFSPFSPCEKRKVYNMGSLTKDAYVVCVRGGGEISIGEFDAYT